MSDSILSVGEISKILRVATRTVSKWIDAGTLTGFRLPGRADRRAYRADVMAFAVRHGFRHAFPLLLNPLAVAVVGFTPDVTERITEDLTREGMTVESHTSLFSAAAESAVGAVVCGPAGEGTSAVRAFAAHVRQTRPHVRLVAVLDAEADEGDRSRLLDAGWHFVTFPREGMGPITDALLTPYGAA